MTEPQTALRARLAVATPDDLERVMFAFRRYDAALRWVPENADQALTDLTAALLPFVTDTGERS